MNEITCAERDRLIDRHVPRGDDGRIDHERRTWMVASSSTNFMDSGIFETTWADRHTGEDVLHERMVRDGPDGWGAVVECRHWTVGGDR